MMKSLSSVFLRILFCFVGATFAVSTASTAHADLHLDSPQELLQRARTSKNDLRTVINEIDLNLSEMRDQATFDRYFFILDELQALATQLNLDSIYPQAVAKLGNRMVQKGVNWLDIVKTSQEHLLYYQRWMSDYQTASSFLYTAGLQIQDQTDRSKLKIAATNLEALMHLAERMWPNEKALLLLYRTTLSDLASKVLKTEQASDNETEFWLTKIFTSDALGEFTTILQSQVYALTESNAGDIHWIQRRLVLVFNHAKDPSFGATEGLTGQIGDSAVDLILKSFRLQEKLTDLEYSQLLGLMQNRHYVALASGWATFGRVPRGEFAGYYLKRAFEFITFLRTKGLGAEANALAQAIDKKTAAINGHQDDIEGTWMMKDNRGVEWRLVIAYATDEVLFASFGDAAQNYIRPFYNVTYDMKNDSFVASERPIDADRSPNRLIRFYHQDDGTLRVVDTDAPLKPAMIAHRTQTYPDLLAQGSLTNAPNMDGVYQGRLTIPGGQTTMATLSISVYSAASVGNLIMFDGRYNSTFNFGTPADNGVVYLTRGNIISVGTWMQIRGKLDPDGYFRGYTIYGGSGIVRQQFALKKVR